MDQNPENQKQEPKISLQGWRRAASCLIFSLSISGLIFTMFAYVVVESRRVTNFSFLENSFMKFDLNSSSEFEIYSASQTVNISAVANKNFVLQSPDGELHSSKIKQDGTYSLELVNLPGMWSVKDFAPFRLIHITAWNTPDSQENSPAGISVETNRVPTVDEILITLILECWFTITLFIPTNLARGLAWVLTDEKKDFPNQDTTEQPKA